MGTVKYNFEYKLHTGYCEILYIAAIDFSLIYMHCDGAHFCYRAILRTSLEDLHAQNIKALGLYSVCNARGYS